MGKPFERLVGDREQAVTWSLFNENNINFDDFQIFGYIKDKSGYTHVSCWQYVNDRKILSDTVIFHFNPDRSLQATTGDIIWGIGADPTPTLDASVVRKIFLERIDKDEALYGLRSMIEDMCFDYTVGYWDLYTGLNHTPEFVLAWQIRSGCLSYPVAIICDKTSSLFYYNNGLDN